MRLALPRVEEVEATNREGPAARRALPPLEEAAAADHGGSAARLALPRLEDVAARPPLSNAKVQRRNALFPTLGRPEPPAKIQWHVSRSHVLGDSRWTRRAPPSQSHWVRRRRARRPHRRGAGSAARRASLARAAARASAPVGRGAGLASAPPPSPPLGGGGGGNAALPAAEAGRAHRPARVRRRGLSPLTPAPRSLPPPSSPPPLALLAGPAGGVSPQAFAVGPAAGKGLKEPVRCHPFDNAVVIALFIKLLEQWPRSMQPSRSLGCVGEGFGRAGRTPY
jgi:hypothetical protein